MGIFRLRPKEDRAAQEPSQNLLRDFGEVGVFFARNRSENPLFSQGFLCPI